MKKLQQYFKRSCINSQEKSERVFKGEFDEFSRRILLLTTKVPKTATEGVEECSRIFEANFQINSQGNCRNSNVAAEENSKEITTLVLKNLRISSNLTWIVDNFSLFTNNLHICTYVCYVIWIQVFDIPKICSLSFINNVSLFFCTITISSVDSCLAHVSQFLSFFSCL